VSLRHTLIGSLPTAALDKKNSTGGNFSSSIKPGGKSSSDFFGYGRWVTKNSSKIFITRIGNAVGSVRLGAGSMLRLPPLPFSCGDDDGVGDRVRSA